MRNRVLATIDLTALGILGAVAGQHGCVQAIRQPEASPEETGAAVGAAAAVLIGLDLFGLRDLPGRSGSGFWLLRVMLGLFGAIAGAKSSLFFSAWDFQRPRVHFFSLMFFVGFVLTYGLARLLKASEAERSASEAERPPGRWSFGLRCLLPAVALAILWFLVGSPSFGTALLAGIGAALGVTWLTALCLWPDSTEPGTPGPGRIERAGGLVACAGVLAVIRIAYLSLSAFMLRRIVTDIAVVSAVAVCGALLGVAMTNRLGRSRQNRSGPAPWLGFSGPRCLLILLLVGLGAVIGRFGLEAVWLSLPALPEPVVDPGALVGGLVAFLLVAGMARSGHAAGRAALEALDLAMGFIHVAVPTGLLLFLAAALLVDRLGGGYPVFLALMYGPLVAGTLGMLGRAWRLYHPLPGHEWAVVAWGWAVSGFFALKQTESLGRIFNLTETIPAVLLVSPLFLILLAFLELFGHEDAETSPARQSTPANAQGPGQS